MVYFCCSLKTESLYCCAWRLRRKIHLEHSHRSYRYRIDTIRYIAFSFQLLNHFISDDMPNHTHLNCCKNGCQQHEASFSWSDWSVHGDDASVFCDRDADVTAPPPPQNVHCNDHRRFHRNDRSHCNTRHLIRDHSKFLMTTHCFLPRLFSSLLRSWYLGSIRRCYITSSKYHFLFL